VNEPVQPDTAKTNAATAAKTILLVDDNPLVVMAYRGALERRGYRVETAEDGLQAMKAAMALKPDLVVLDLLMPKLDGSYVLKFIHTQAALKTVKVIVLSDATNVDMAKSALEQKPDAVFHKSHCTASLLAEKINELLNHSQT
jgi:DNA-binding response OmpR family regulator